jgi:hypothetical protein
LKLKTGWVGIIAMGLFLLTPLGAAGQEDSGQGAFWDEALKTLPLEDAYAYHRRLKEEPVHTWQRSRNEKPTPQEVEILDEWELVYPEASGDILKFAVNDFRDYLKVSMGVNIRLSTGWSEDTARVIRVATRTELAGCAADLRAPKDYRLQVTKERITVCGYDERGALYGLMNLESRMNLRGAPFLPDGLDSLRHSLLQTRMVLNWLGWMQWPDNYLAHLVHDGFDAIYASVYANPNGVPLDEPGYRNMRRQDPERMQDLLDRAARFGIKVYAPILYRYTDTPENERGLRELVRDIVTRFPSIRGYILLTEGFYYDAWFGAGNQSDADLQAWAQKWSKAVGIVAEECHRIDPSIEVLPWEYNIDFRPQRADLKRYVIGQLPRESIPLLTWENGKSFRLEGYQGYLRDYSINVVGPAEVTEAQIEEVKKRGMKVYAKADTFASWQFGTIPYLPVPFQWHRRYEALTRFGVNGTHESWSNGYKPNVITALRSWYCWTDAPALEPLLKSFARRLFGPGQEDLVVQAWRLFSQGIQDVPDTGPSMGTNNAVANPLFWKEPYPRTMTLRHSWWDQQKWSNWQSSYIYPEWPYSPTFLTFLPDFRNQTNRAEQYALSHSGLAGIENQKVTGEEALKIFRKYLLRAADQFEEGLKLYRRAAMSAPDERRVDAFREVLLVEQMQNMLRSCEAILAFEDHRFRFEKGDSNFERQRLLDEMRTIAEQELARTARALEAARRDSRLGYEFEHDYVYTPRVIEEKIQILKGFLENDYSEARRQLAN